jgi:acetylornithine deacetylase/succinyl-diaminopimelate desuccinylase-like protein
MTYFQEHQSDFLESLKTFLRIPSISTLSEHKPDIRRAAEFAMNQLRAAGMSSVELIESAAGGNPLVYAEWLAAPGKPTILFYGHYDVQPADPLDEWKSPPFEPAVRNHNIYARGAVDDKGQVMIQIKAVEGLLKTTGKLPVNVKFLLEGEEETGGEHIEAYVKTKPPRLEADTVVVCDTEMFAPELPSICIGLRGLIYYELFVEGASHDLHSGVYGGAAPNPIMAIAEILTALKDRCGHILIPGFYDRVVPPAEKERAAWASLPFDPKQYTEEEMGARELTGEPGISVFERTWGRPTLEVHGIRGGFTGEGAKTVIPARAVAKISTRLVGDQQVDECIELTKAAVKAATPKGVTAELKVVHTGAPSLTNPDNPYIHAAADALKQTWGKDTVYIRSGGSIPIVGVFDRYLGIPSVMMGFGLPDDNLHAPNEKFHLPNFYRGIETVARYLEILGG